MGTSVPSTGVLRRALGEPSVIETCRVIDDRTFVLFPDRAKLPGVKLGCWPASPRRRSNGGVALDDLRGPSRIDLRVVTVAPPERHPAGVPYGLMDFDQCKEQFSKAYTHAVATAARCKMEHIEVDDEVVDVVIRQKATHEVYRSANVEVQLKCTSQDVVRPTHINHRLTKKHHDALRDDKRFGNIILVVLVVPEDLTRWLAQDEIVTRMHKAAYWMSLRGLPEITDDTTTVKVPRSNTFDVEQLLGILSRIGNGGRP